MQFWKRAQSFGFELPRFLHDASLASQGQTHQNILNTETFPGTSCVKLSGNVLMNHLLMQCKALSETRYAHHRKPCLAVILAGDDPASAVYVSHKQKRFEECGFNTKLVTLNADLCSVAKIENIIDELNAAADIDGILLQLPLPNSIDASPLLDRISPEKDVDGFHVLNTGYLASGRYEGLLPCTPFGIFALLQSYHVDLEGLNVTVVGRSNIVGKPASYMAINARATVTVVHKLTKDIVPFTRTADVLIVGAGVHHLIRKNHVKEGAIVVDVGIHSVSLGDSNQAHSKRSSKIEGDVHPEVRSVARMATPVPGGVGPMTIAMLCVNTAMACWKNLEQ